MKHYCIILIILLFKSNSYSCECVYTSLFKRVKSHNYIAKVKILESKKAIDFNDIYRPYSVKIATEKQYYGKKTNSIHLESMSDASCGIYLQEGTEWVIFGYTNPENGLTYTSLCSENFQLDKKIDSLKYYNYYKEYPKERTIFLNILDRLKVNEIKNSDFFEGYFTPKDNNVSDLLKSLNYLKSKENFGCYKLTISNDGEVIKSKLINKLDNKVDKIILKKIIKTKWNIHLKDKEVKEIFIIVLFDANNLENKYRLYPI